MSYEDSPKVKTPRGAPGQSMPCHSLLRRKQLFSWIIRTQLQPPNLSTGP